VIRDAAVAALLVAGVALELLCVLGVAAMRGPYDRLHYTGPASFGAALLCGAVLAREGFSVIGDKAILIAAFLLFSSPVLVHVTARAARIRELGDLDIRPHEMPGEP
jgi:multicomponent Na+:H+ antiporter subunit G